MSWHGDVLHYQDEEDWLAQRRAGIGASDVPKILGMSPYGDAFTVWADKVYGAEQEQTEDMLRGKRREDVILEDFELEKGLYVRHRQLFVAHPQYSWVRATVDGLAFESPTVDSDPVTDAIALVEAKHDGGFARWQKVPDHHQIQVQWQMLTTGLDVGFLAVWHSGRFESYELEADRGLQNMMLDRVNDFRARHITGGIGERTPPEPGPSTATAQVIANLWEADPDIEVELSADIAADVEALRGVKIRIRDLDKEKKKLEARIKVELQEATVGTVGGEQVVSWKEVHRDAYTVKEARYRRLETPKRKERS
jgi:putative phage-type endonuclease